MSTKIKKEKNIFQKLFGKVKSEAWIECATTRDDRKIIIIGYTIKNFGFGEIQIIQKDGKIKIDSETLDKKAVSEILKLMVDQAETCA
jgi:hypothetical protein